MTNDVICRTVFHFGRSLSQVVLHPDHCDLQWTSEEISPLDEDTFKVYFLTKRAQDISKNINQHISSIPPYRVSSFTTLDHVFLAISIHHSLFDGIALPCLILEVEREYLGRQHQPIASAEEILSCIGNIDRDQARAFWTSHFEGFAWPRQIPTSEHAGGHHHSVSFVSPLSAIKLLASSQRITLQALLTGAFALHAARDIFKSTDVAFGVSHQTATMEVYLYALIGFTVRSPSASRLCRISDFPSSLGCANTRQFQQHAKRAAVHSARDFCNGRVRTPTSRQCSIVGASRVSVVRCSFFSLRGSGVK